MITLQPEDGFILYLFLALGGLCAFAVYEAWRANSRQWLLSKGRLIRCPECNYTYIVKRAENMGCCPRCRKVRTVRGASSAVGRK